MKAKPLPTVEYLKECFDYNPESGCLIWKVRPIYHFQDSSRMNQSNSRNSGKTVSMISAAGYIEMKINGITYKSHRVIWKMITNQEPLFIDHINGDRSDNRFCNLRMVNKLQNSRNRSISKNNDSGITGVSYHSRDCKWQSYITVNDVRINLGSFKSFDKAVESRNHAEIKYFGEFRRIK